MFEKEAEKYATVDLPDGYTKIDYQKKADWQKGAEFGYNKAYNKAKELIKEILSILPKENIEGIYEITEEAEEFIKG